MLNVADILSVSYPDAKLLVLADVLGAEIAQFNMPLTVSAKQLISMYEDTPVMGIKLCSDKLEVRLYSTNANRTELNDMLQVLLTFNSYVYVAPEYDENKRVIIPLRDISPSIHIEVVNALTSLNISSASKVIKATRCGDDILIVCHALAPESE